MINFDKKRNKLIKKGFTLIESLIAIFIFSVAVISLMSMAARGVATARNAQASLTAQFFAQEGIEFVHNIRDSAFLDTSPSQCGVGGNPGQCLGIEKRIPSFKNCLTTATNTEDIICGVGYDFDKQQLVLLDGCANIDDVCPIYKLTSPSSDWPPTYLQESGMETEETIFNRQIFIREIVNRPQEVEIEVVVGWNDGSRPRSISVKENLLLWQ